MVDVRSLKDEFDAFLGCGILTHGFLRLRCGDCGHDRLVAFSRKYRGACPSCGARRMAQTAAHLVDHVIYPMQVRQCASAPVRQCASGYCHCPSRCAGGWPCSPSW